MHVGDVHASVLETDKKEKKTCQLQPRQRIKKAYTFENYTCIFLKIILIEKLTVSTCLQSSAISCLLSSRTSGIEDSASRELPAVK